MERRQGVVDQVKMWRRGHWALSDTHEFRKSSVRKRMDQSHVDYAGCPCSSATLFRLDPPLPYAYHLTS
jgi:hypothetical protein